MLNLIFDAWKIARKDLTEFIRDKLRLVTFVIMPIFMMTLVGFIFPSQNSLKNIPIGIANEDSGQVGAAYVQMLKNFKTNGSNVFEVKEYSNLEAVKEGIREQKISGGLVTPSNLTSSLTANTQVEVTIVQDQSNPQISALTNQILQQTVAGFGQQIGAKKVGALLVRTEKVNPQLPVVTSPSPLAFIEPIKSTITGLVSGKTNYFDFVAPGIMAMVVMTAVLTGLAASVSRENEQGTLDGILVAPIRRLSIIFGKAMAQSIRGLIQGIIVLLLSVFLFGVTIHGSLLLVMLVLALGIFSFVGLGILVSAAASEQETATQLLFMFQFPMLFLSGAFFPLQQMPKIMQDIAHVLPLTYAIEALRKIMILGGGISDVRNELIILVVFGAVTLIIALPLFNRLVKR
jgi:ABC-2 type transport system permease protein